MGGKVGELGGSETVNGWEEASFRVWKTQSGSGMKEVLGNDGLGEQVRLRGLSRAVEAVESVWGIPGEHFSPFRAWSRRGDFLEERPGAESGGRVSSDHSGQGAGDGGQDHKGQRRKGVADAQFSQSLPCFHCLPAQPDWSCGERFHRPPLGFVFKSGFFFITCLENYPRSKENEKGK